MLIERQQSRHATRYNNFSFFSLWYVFEQALLPTASIVNLYGSNGSLSTMSHPQMAMTEAPRSRLSAVQSNVRNLLRNSVASSIYSRSASASATPTPVVPPVPQLPSFAYLRRQRVSTDEEARPPLQHVSSREALLQTSHSSTSSPPLRQPEIQGVPSRSARVSLWHEQPEAVTIAVGGPSPRDDESWSDADEENGINQHVIGTSVEEPLPTNSGRRRRRRRHCKKCRSGRGAWFKHKHRQSLWKGRTRAKCICAAISGVLLIVLLATCKSSPLSTSPQSLLTRP